MRKEIDLLRQQNIDLLKNVQELTSSNDVLSETARNLQSENAELKDKVASLQGMCNELKEAEDSLRAHLEGLESKMVSGAELDTLKLRLEDLSSAQADTKAQIDELMEAVTQPVALSSSIDTTSGSLPDSGIFAYFENPQDAQLFIQVVDDAVCQGMTYAKIDEYLTQQLPSELDKILKDHPSLTKNYIREKRNS